MDDEIKDKLKYLGIKGLEERWDDLIKEGEGPQMSSARFLRHLVDTLFAAKQSHARSGRLLNAKMPEHWIMATYPFAKQPKLNKKRIMSLHDSLDYMTKRQNIILVGPTGTGKSGLGTAFLVQAIDAGYRGRFITFPDLLDELYKSVAAHREARVLKAFASYDCLLCDELGYVDAEPSQVGLFFRLMSMRHRTKTTIITTNLGFQEWTSFLKNQQLTASLLDRLTENSHVINMRGCVSIRPKLAGSEPVADPSPEGDRPAAQPSGATKVQRKTEQGDVHDIRNT